MLKYIYICLVFLGLIACKQKQNEVQKENPVEDVVVVQKEQKKESEAEHKKLSELDSIRQLIQATYAKAKKIDTPVSSPIYQESSGLCTPCDMQYLVALSKKQDYNMAEVKKLLCLDNHDQCENNAEFTQFYNEIVFKVFQRERNDFTDDQIKMLLDDEELIEELLYPVTENVDVNLLSALKADAANPND